MGPRAISKSLSEDRGAVLYFISKSMVLALESHWSGRNWRGNDPEREAQLIKYHTGRA